MDLDRVFDIIEVLLNAAEHPDIVAVERYGPTGGQPWGPADATSKSKTVTGVKVRHKSAATASLWAAVWPGEVPVDMPATMPPPVQRMARLSILTIQLLDAARPADFKSWHLVALPNLGPTDGRGASPMGVSLACADGTKVLLRASSTGAMAGQEPTEEPAPDYVIPAGVSSCLQ